TFIFNCYADPLALHSFPTRRSSDLRLRALLFLFQQLLGHEALGEKQARRHAGHREQVGLGVEKAGEIAALEKRALALVRAVVREKDLAILHGASYFPSNPTRSMVARSACSVC